MVLTLLAVPVFVRMLVGSSDKHELGGTPIADSHVYVGFDAVLVLWNSPSCCWKAPSVSKSAHFLQQKDLAVGANEAPLRCSVPSEVSLGKSDSFSLVSGR